jgi:lysylphosphatidylglycerol synthetase-like protein (DUF2156 family)
MVDAPGVLFVGAACFLCGLVCVDLFWDIRTVAEPYTEETADAITAFYTNNVVGTRRRAPYLIMTMPLAFLIVIGALAYKCIHGLDVGDERAVMASAVSMIILFPLIALAATSTFPTIGALIAKGGTLPLETRFRMQRRLFVQHVIYLVLTAAAVVAHVAL